jgi:hypothetical protein
MLPTLLTLGWAVQPPSRSSTCQGQHSAFPPHLMAAAQCKGTLDNSTGRSYSQVAEEVAAAAAGVTTGQIGLMKRIPAELSH